MKSILASLLYLISSLSIASENFELKINIPSRFIRLTIRLSHGSDLNTTLSGVELLGSLKIQKQLGLKAFSSEYVRNDQESYVRFSGPYIPGLYLITIIENAMFYTENGVEYYDDSVEFEHLEAILKIDRSMNASSANIEQSDEILKVEMISIK